ncbi:MAG: hypothetical protein ABJO02_02335 [Reichenbachiella sp.]|uniref:hypothetical protein n=1 Tax=Reichenbachiella sp. TaxID=2184521 RepID=UPI00329A624C
MKIIVNDANILIDLVELQLLPHFFGLEFEFTTTNLIIDELLADQQEALSPYVDKGELIIAEVSEEDVLQIAMINSQKPTLSEQDCSAFLQAQNNGATLLTSDNSLRKFAKENELPVHGHLWVFDCMVEQGTITGERACLKLQILTEEINPRLGLPKKECSSRIALWKKT